MREACDIITSVLMYYTVRFVSDNATMLMTYHGQTNQTDSSFTDHPLRSAITDVTRHLVHFFLLTYVVAKGVQRNSITHNLTTPGMSYSQKPSVFRLSPFEVCT